MRVCVFLALAALCCGCAFGRESQSPQASDNEMAELVPDFSGPEVARGLESRVESNPEDLFSRTRLLSIYMEKGTEADFMRHMIWFIQNHPDSKALSLGAKMRPQGGSFNSASDYQEVAGLWDAQLAAHPENAGLKLGAAKFLSVSNPERALELSDEARRVDTSNKYYLMEEVNLFKLMITRPASGAANNTDLVKAKLMSSNDPELLSATGQMLRIMASTKEFGFQLMQRAVLLDPDNRTWSDRLSRARNPQLTAAGPFRIEARVAEANLIQKIEPQYPALAESARISGTVEFTVTIGEDGLVKNILLVRGHPLLVNAAKDAVTQWRYKPTLLNGNPVAVMTDVIVPFTLVQ